MRGSFPPPTLPRAPLADPKLFSLGEETSLPLPEGMALPFRLAGCRPPELPPPPTTMVPSKEFPPGPSRKTSASDVKVRMRLEGSLRRVRLPATPPRDPPVPDLEIPPVACASSSSLPFSSSSSSLSPKSSRASRCHLGVDVMDLGE